MSNENISGEQDSMTHTVEVGRLVPLAKDLHAAPDSPLATLVDGVPAHGEEITDATLISYVGVLAAPVASWNATLVSDDAVIAWEFHQGRQGEILGVAHEGESVRFSGPYSGAELAVFMSTFFRNRVEPSFDAHVALSSTSLAAFIAASDAWLEEMLAGMLLRHPKPPELDEDALIDAVKRGCAHPDPRWKVSVLDAVDPQFWTAKPDLVRTGVDELAELGLLDRSVSGGLVPGGLIRGTASLEQLPSVHVAGDGRDLIVVGAGRHALAIELGDNPHVQLLGYNGLVSTFTEHLTLSAKSRPVEVGSWFWVDTPTLLVDDAESPVGRVEPGEWYEVLATAPGLVRVMVDGTSGWMDRGAVKQDDKGMERNES